MGFAGGKEAEHRQNGTWRLQPASGRFDRVRPGLPSLKPTPLTPSGAFYGQPVMLLGDICV